MTFVRFVCWDPSFVDLVAPDDAAATPASVLAAVHQPMDIRVFRDGMALDDRVTEHDVLNELCATEAPVTMIGLVGKSGAGKSHLVRWLNAQLDQTDRYVVLYVS